MRTSDTGVREGLTAMLGEHQARFDALYRAYQGEAEASETTRARLWLAGYLSPPARAAAVGPRRDRRRTQDWGR